MIVSSWEYCNDDGDVHYIDEWEIGREVKENLTEFKRQDQKKEVSQFHIHSSPHNSLYYLFLSLSLCVCVFAVFRDGNEYSTVWISSNE